MTNTIPDLSIVIIARNEAENIARAIESVLRGVEHWPQTEILLVDSASMDGTVEIARQYPINIVRLDPAWFLSASAGRYIGMRYSRGDLIMYMDGDMELAPEWLDQAVPFILEHPELGGVTGYRRDIHVRDGQIVGEQDQGRDPQGRSVQVRHFGGAAIYRRSPLEQVGGFNPYIISGEEPELCMRMRHAGYKLMRLPYLICKNYTLPMNSWKYCVRRFQTNMWSGAGQVLRYHLKTGLFWRVLRERGSYVPVFASVLISTASLLLAVVFKNVWILAPWAFMTCLTLGVYGIKKRSLRKALMSIVLRGFIAYGIVRGFLMAPKLPTDYPTDAEIVQVHYHPGHLPLEAQVGA
jgi:glycosyltransferase involved in cell wall biosynthesis